MAVSTAATRTLDRLAIPYRVFEHAAPPATLEQAARERGQEPRQVVRSILFRRGKEQFVLVLIAGPGQISWKRLRAHLGVSRLSMASKAEVQEATGYETGVVSPLGLPRPLRILADGGVFEPEEISLGCGARGAAIVMKSADLRRALGEVEVGKFAV